jgi:hypothetical protein
MAGAKLFLSRGGCHEQLVENRHYRFRNTYTRELIEGIIKRKDALPLSEILLMDIDQRKLDIVGTLYERMIKAAGVPCRVVRTQNLDEALTGADFVLAQIRVGKLPARVLDEKIPLKYINSITSCSISRRPPVPYCGHWNWPAAIPSIRIPGGE